MAALVQIDAEPKPKRRCLCLMCLYNRWIDGSITDAEKDRFIATTIKYVAWLDEFTSEQAKLHFPLESPVDR